MTLGTLSLCHLTEMVSGHVRESHVWLHSLQLQPGMQRLVIRMNGRLGRTEERRGEDGRFKISLKNAVSGRQRTRKFGDRDTFI